MSNLQKTSFSLTYGDSVVVARILTVRTWYSVRKCQLANKNLIAFSKAAAMDRGIRVLANAGSGTVLSLVWETGTACEATIRRDSYEDKSRITVVVGEASI